MLDNSSDKIRSAGLSLPVKGRQPVTNGWRERVRCPRAEGSSSSHSGGSDISLPAL